MCSEWRTLQVDQQGNRRRAARRIRRHRGAGQQGVAGARARRRRTDYLPSGGFDRSRDGSTLSDELENAGERGRLQAGRRRHRRCADLRAVPAGRHSLPEKTGAIPTPSNRHPARKNRQNPRLAPGAEHRAGKPTSGRYQVRGRKSYRVSVNGTEYDVVVGPGNADISQITAAAPAAAAAPAVQAAPPPAAPAAAGPGTAIKAPLAGSIIDVLVSAWASK